MGPHNTCMLKQALSVSISLNSESSRMITYHATAGLAIDHPLWSLFAFAAAHFAVFHTQIGSDISRDHLQFFS